MLGQLTNLNFAYHDQPVISIPQLRFEKNSKLFIEGDSGTGKSTLLHLLCGLLRPDTGQITLLNQCVSKLSSSKRDQFRADHMGVIFQNFNLVPYLTIEENIALTTQFSKHRKAKILARHNTVQDEIQRLCSRLGLSENQLKSPVSQLSIGQQQRVAAARALLGAPEIMIADEPTSALDPHNTKAFLDLLFEECDRAKSTLIFVSHDQRLKSQFTTHLNLKVLNQA